MRAVWGLMMDWRDPKPEFLPGLLCDVARVIGVAHALRLAEGWNGRRYIPRKLADGHPLMQMLGREMAGRALCALGTPGDTVLIPSAIHQRRWLAAHHLYCGRGWTKVRIGQHLGLGETQVRKLLRGVQPASTAERDSSSIPHCPLCGQADADEAA